MSESIIRIVNVLFDGRICDCEIRGNRFTAIAPGLPPPEEGAVVIDGTRKALTPAFYNAHNHAAMTLLRGYGDDMELFQWLQERIWPFEARLEKEDILIGTRLAILEMIRSGTVFFNDMYWLQAATAAAVEEMGVRAAIGLLLIDNAEEKCRRSIDEIWEMRHDLSPRIQIASAPHAIYTVSEENLRREAEFARANGLRLHIHVSETAAEVADCRRLHNGLTPVEYLHRLGLSGPDTVYAHGVHLTEHDIAIIAETGTLIAHCPCSNMKLVSGLFPYREAVEKGGCRVAIGTDGCSSNNNLSMPEEMKFAALCAKIGSGDPTAGCARDILRAGTRTGAEFFGIDAGVIAPGKLADCLLVDLDTPQFAMNYDLASDMVYAADSSCISTVICDGRILMRDRIIPGSEDIIAAARSRAEFYKKRA